MIAIRWFLRMIRDVIAFGAVNDAYAVSLVVLLLLVVGLLIIGAQVSAPFIYTLF